jgi:hypothetical protein
MRAWGTRQKEIAPDTRIRNLLINAEPMPKFFITKRLLFQQMRLQKGVTFITYSDFILREVRRWNRVINLLTNRNLYSNSFILLCTSQF